MAWSRTTPSVNLKSRLPVMARSISRRAWIRSQATLKLCVENEDLFLEPASSP